MGGEGEGGNKPQIETDLFNWHLANLELANADRLEACPSGRDQDDPYDFDGDHVWLPGGNVRLVSAMARELPIFYGHAVTSWSTHGCRGGPAVGGARGAREDRGRAHEGGGDARSEFRADAALVTVPLGVLKKGSRADSREEESSDWRWALASSTR